MPVDWSKYPKDWKAIARRIKDKADWKCQECGKPCRKPREGWSDFRWRISNSDWYHLTGEKPQRFTLTVAHLNHNSMDCRPENLRAMCAPCHLRYDARHHAKNAAQTRQLKKSEVQLSLLEVKS